MNHKSQSAMISDQSQSHIWQVALYELRLNLRTCYCTCYGQHLPCPLGDNFAPAFSLSLSLSYCTWCVFFVLRQQTKSVRRVKKQSRKGKKQCGRLTSSYSLGMLDIYIVFPLYSTSISTSQATILSASTEYTNSCSLQWRRRLATFFALAAAVRN